MKTRIKFCGMTCAEDAAFAVALGVNEVGLVFAGGPRKVSIEQAQQILNGLPEVTVTGLFMNQPENFIRQVLSEVKLDQLQFHGQESAQFCDQFQMPWTKALAAGENVDLADLINSWQSSGRYGPVAVVLDAHRSGERGGQGKIFDWERVPSQPSVPVYLAGGLNVDNVRYAVRQLKPYAVDVSSGIEDSPGRKNHATMQCFVNEVRTADAKID